MNEGVGNCELVWIVLVIIGIKTKLKQLDTELALLKTTQFQTETIQWTDIEWKKYILYD